MTFIAATYTEALILANDLRSIYCKDGYRVTIVRPLFVGDSYRVNVA